ncbi:hypothetical protein ZMO1_ZMO2030 [Zymomonas mobilis subsp. mobilis ZM4 = ATCC 31821]|uniref:Uncharacterized protein n=1 Tax=Zymomonas mobilis subsp. mobilis (strain ATCC 31821 / ZM4 / CP4) TaxID=264203 RepID=D2N0X8_ZYMMO|nr:hypothetical protein Za10_1380 [Zymomonas mobilis subsp. mobilis NCIMB 11163]ADB28980.1 hypothetical protein ZMO2030 [Zymomonas mobilis subsp. mobilis ZM4 = ATCC 31821]AVZ26662.1 hypothetical protein ZMO2_ZMO2030 [Zymomonas mobilis subsp. mobilis]AVZ28548.1 hypothetical protein ZMO3_ZMO2030 [Zymomonas mobilis subsp. mobilis]AVZ42994.1 hypothetical protein ZMO1_ZMO2030 [Zymomonas mobilis subsp. mobilis ZM4 = ATCC 31821]
MGMEPSLLFFIYELTGLDHLYWTLEGLAFLQS